MATLHSAPDMLFLTTKASLAISQTPGSDLHSWVLSGLLPPTIEKDYKHKSAAKLISKEKMDDGSHSGHMSHADGSHSGHYAPNKDGSHSGHMGPTDGSHYGHYGPNLDDSHSGHMSNQDGSHSGHMSVMDGSHSGHYAPEDGSLSGHFGPNADGSHSGHMAPITIHSAPDMLFNATKASLAISKTEGTDIESWVRTGERPRTSEKDYKHKSAAKLISEEKLGGAGLMVDGSHSGHMCNKDGSHSGHMSIVDGSHSGHMSVVDVSHSGHYSNMDGSHSGHYSLEDGCHSGHMASTAPSTTGSFDYEPKRTQELILKRKLALKVLADEHQQKGSYGYEEGKEVRIFGELEL